MQLIGLITIRYTYIMNIGVIGSEGDLGKQLSRSIKAAGFALYEHDLKNNKVSQAEIFASCDIIHLCIPLDKFLIEKQAKDNVIIVLHDSVMSTSQLYNHSYFSGQASIVHMLMNKNNSVVIADGTAHQDSLLDHFNSLGFTPRILPLLAHDKLMAQSQAPLALLIKSLHVPLHQQYEQGLLTPSGELLMNALDSRVLEWTPETIASILRNPMLNELINDITKAHELK